MALDLRLRHGSSALNIINVPTFSSPFDWYGTLRNNGPFNAGIYSGPPVGVLPSKYSEQENSFKTDLAYDATFSDESVPALSADSVRSLRDLRRTSTTRAGSIFVSSSTHPLLSGNFTAIARLPFNVTGYVNSALFVAEDAGTIRLKEIVRGDTDHFTISQDLGEFSVDPGINNIQFDPITVRRGSYLGVFSSVAIKVAEKTEGIFWWIGSEPDLSDTFEPQPVTGYDLCLYASDRPLHIAARNDIVGGMLDLGGGYDLRFVKLRCSAIDISDVTLLLSEDMVSWETISLEAVINNSTYGELTGTSICTVDESGLYLLKRYDSVYEGSFAQAILGIQNGGGGSIQLRQLRYEYGAYQTVAYLTEWMNVEDGDLTIELDPTLMEPGDFLALAYRRGASSLLLYAQENELLRETCRFWTTDLASSTIPGISMLTGSASTTVNFRATIIDHWIADCEELPEGFSSRYARFSIQEPSRPFLFVQDIEIEPHSEPIGFGPLGTETNQRVSNTAKAGEISEWLAYRVFNDSEDTATQFEISILPDGREAASKFVDLSQGGLYTDPLIRNCASNAGDHCLLDNPRFAFPYGADREAPDCGCICPQWSKAAVLSSNVIFGGSFAGPLEKDRFVQTSTTPGKDYDADSYSPSRLPLFALNNEGDPSKFWTSMPSNSHFIWALLTGYYNLKQFVLKGSLVVPTLKVYGLTTDGSPNDEDSWELLDLITNADLVSSLTITLDTAFRSRGFKVAFDLSSDEAITLETLEAYSFQGFSGGCYFRTSYPEDLPRKNRTVKLRTRMIY